jgi:hypothetical protein
MRSDTEKETIRDVSGGDSWTSLIEKSELRNHGFAKNNRRFTRPLERYMREREDCRK